MGDGCRIESGMTFFLINGGCVRGRRTFTLTSILSPRGRGRLRMGLLHRKGIIHPHLNPLPSRERKTKEGVI